MNVEAPVLRQEDQFRELIGVIRRRKAIVWASVLLFAILGAVSAALVAPTYQVTQRIVLQNYHGGPSSSPIDAVARMSQVGDAPEIPAQVGLMTSPLVLDELTRATNIPQSVEAQAISVVQEDGPLLDIVVTMSDPAQASLLASQVPDAYQTVLGRQIQAQIDEVSKGLTTRLKTAQDALDKSQSDYEKALMDQGGEPVVAQEGEGAERTSRLNAAQQQLDSSRVALATAQEDLAATTAARSKIPERVVDYRINSAAEQAVQLKAQIASEQAQLQSLLTTYRENYPDVVSLRARIRKEQQTLAGLPKGLDQTSTIRNPERLTYDSRVTEFQTRVRTDQEQVAKYEAIVARERKGIEEFQKRIPARRKLQNDISQKAGTVQDITRSLNDLQSVASGRSPIQKLATYAPLKTQVPVTRTIITATLLGLLLGITLALLRDRLDNRIYTLEQIYDVSGAVPIGQVPSSVKALSSGTSGQARNRVLESYRSLRFNLESTAAAGTAQSVLIASATGGEGRAGLSLNLATEAATDARKTILVDGDLRTPELHDLLKLPRSPGLSDVLAGTTDLDSVLRTTGQDNLLFLPAGSEHPTPLELLVGPSLASLHEALKERADVIVINSPSLMRYTDARAIANVADTVLFVAKRGFTRRDAMRYCIGMLRRAHARLLGVVLSDDANRTTDVPYLAGD